MRYSGPAIILLAFTVACTESGTEPPLATLKVDSAKPVRVLEPGQYPEEIPPELRVPAILHSVEADAGWSPDGFAYAGATVEYTATSAYIEATVESDSGRSTLHDQKNGYLPLRGSLQAPVPTRPMRVCTGTIRGVAVGVVWNEFVGLTVLKWGEQRSS